MIRRRLLALVLVVVTGLVASTVATSIVLRAMDAPESVARNGMICTCVHGAEGECPMHKSHKAVVPPISSSHEARFCNGSGDNSEMVLTTLLFAGSVVDRLQAAAPESVSELVAATATHPLDLVLPLVSPPPRV